MQGMANGEVDADLCGPPMSQSPKLNSRRRLSTWCDGYVPQPDHRWNSKFAVRKEDKSLMEFINEGIKELRVDGTMKKIVESYGVPFYAPFP